MAPFISVVTPSLNQARYIEKTLQSVLDQHYPDFEHIVMDGNSQDGTTEILKKYSHLRWVSEPDNGIPEALNKAFKMAGGDIIAWINSDDHYTEGTFQKVASFFAQNPQAAVLVGRAAVIDEKGELLFYQEEPAQDGFAHAGMIRFWKHATLPQPSIFFRRSIFDEIGFLDEGLKSYMEYDFFLRLSRTHRFYRSEDIFSRICLHSESGSVKDIASGRLRKVLYQISRRYWGQRGSSTFYRHFFSYWFFWPRTIWKAYYDQFAFAIKKQSNWRRPEPVSMITIWRFRKQFLQYPLPAMVAACKSLFRRMRLL